MFCLELFINIDSKLYYIVRTISTSLKTIPVLRKDITLQEESFHGILINSAYSEFAKFNPTKYLNYADFPIIAYTREFKKPKFMNN